MIEYRTSEDNKNYYVVENPGEFISFIESNYYSGNRIIHKARNSFDKLRNEIENHDYVFKNLAIRKDSDLGLYISRDRKGYFFVDLDEKVSYKDIINAYNVSIVEEHPYMEVLKEMVVEEVSGNRSRLRDKYTAELIDYIGENKDFYKYYEVKKGTYNTSDSIVYDDEFKVANLYEMSKTGKALVK